LLFQIHNLYRYAVVDDEPERRTIELQERILGPLPGRRGQFLAAAEEDRPFAQPTEQQLAAGLYKLRIQSSHSFETAWFQPLKTIK
jgi:hypothetical protein